MSHPLVEVPVYRAVAAVILLLMFALNIVLRPLEIGVPRVPLTVERGVVNIIVNICMAALTIVLWST